MEVGEGGRFLFASTLRRSQSFQSPSWSIWKCCQLDDSAEISCEALRVGHWPGSYGMWILLPGFRHKGDLALISSKDASEFSVGTLVFHEFLWCGCISCETSESVELDP